MSTDLTVVVTAHDETVVCGPTMRAADLAVETARERGFGVQTVISLDAPTEATSTYFHQPHFDHWERRVRSDREPGAGRDVLVRECDGRYLAVLNAGDLCSENWLAEGAAVLDLAAGRGEHVVAHPELHVVFDGQKAVFVNSDQDSPLFTPHLLYFRPDDDAPCIAAREAHLEVPYQDVEFTIETMRAGWQHVVAKDTIIFKRRRDLPLVTESAGRPSIGRALPAMTIDRVRDLGSARR